MADVVDDVIPCARCPNPADCLVTGCLIEAEDPDDEPDDDDDDDLGDDDDDGDDDATVDELQCAAS